MYAPILGITGQFAGTELVLLGGRSLKWGVFYHCHKKAQISFVLLCGCKDLLEVGQCVDEVGLAVGDDADFPGKILISFQEARDAVFLG